jgi:hypothetical protein
MPSEAEDSRAAENGRYKIDGTLMALSPVKTIEKDP